VPFALFNDILITYQKEPRANHTSFSFSFFFSFYQILVLLMMTLVPLARKTIRWLMSRQETFTIASSFAQAGNLTIALNASFTDPWVID
jgi:hypothetical protein